MKTLKKIISLFALATLLCSSSLAYAATSPVVFEGKSISVKSEVQGKKQKEPVKKVTKKVVKKVVKKIIKKVPPPTQKKPTGKPTPKQPTQQQPAQKQPTPTQDQSTEKQPVVKSTPANHDVTLENFAFAPSELKIKVGDTVTFTQKDTAPHKIDTDPHPQHTQLPGFDSDVLTQGQTYTYTFTKAGTFTYHCHLHPSMKGTVVVE